MAIYTITYTMERAICLDVEASSLEEAERVAEAIDDDYDLYDRYVDFDDDDGDYSYQVEARSDDDVYPDLDAGDVARILAKTSNS